MATKCHFRHVEVEGKLNKRSKKGGANGSVTTYPRKSFQREPGILGSKHAVKFSRAPGTKLKIRERKGPSRGIIPKCAPQERSPCAKIRGKITGGHLCTKKDAPAKQRGIWRNICRKFKNSDKKLRGARICSCFRSINAHDDQKRIKLR